MSPKSLAVLALVLVAACAEPPMGPSVSNSRRSSPPPPVQHPIQTCRAQQATASLTTVPGALAKQCGAKA